MHTWDTSPAATSRQQQVVYQGLDLALEIAKGRRTLYRDLYIREARHLWVPGAQDDMNDQAEDLSESGDSSAVGPASANKEADKDLTKLPQLH